jgi:hypothetical protein
MGSTGRIAPLIERCASYEDIIARYLHGGVLLQEKEDLESHLSVCVRCENLYREVTGLHLVLRDLPGKGVDPPPYLHGRIMANLPDIKRKSYFLRWAYRAGAGAAAVAAAALLFLVFHDGRVPRNDAAVKSRAPAADSPAATAAKPREKKTAGPGMVASAPKVRVIREVRIYFYYPQARNVAVTGDFNGWDPEGVPLKASGKPGLWETQLRLPPGAYSYNFIVDGNILVPDPNADTQMPDGYGGTNSILLVRNGNPA